MSFTSENMFSLPPLLHHVNYRLLENPHPRSREPSTPDSCSTTSPDPNWWEYNGPKYWAECSRRNLDEVVVKCEADIAKLVKSSAEDAPDQMTRILAHFEEGSRERVTQIFTDFEATRDWFRTESQEDPAVITLQDIAELSLTSIEILGNDNVVVDTIYLKEGQYRREQKEYWYMRRCRYDKKKGLLREGRKELWTLYRKSRSQKHVRNAVATAASPGKTRLITRSQQIQQGKMADQLQPQNASERDQRAAQKIARRRTKEEYCHQHLSKSVNADPSTVEQTASPPLTQWPCQPAHIEPRNDLAERKPGKCAKKPRNHSAPGPSRPNGSLKSGGHKGKQPTVSSSKISKIRRVSGSKQSDTLHVNDTKLSPWSDQCQNDQQQRPGMSCALSPGWKQQIQQSGSASIPLRRSTRISKRPEQFSPS